MKAIGYVLADFPVFSETFVGNEMRAVMAQGHRVTPIVMRAGRGRAHDADLALAAQATQVSGVASRDAARMLARPDRRAAGALGFALRQTRLPARSLLWNAMKVAAVARRDGCRHLHAHFAGGAAAHAIVAARWLGVSVSFVCHGHDVYAEAEDLGLKLRSADAVVAVCDDMADDLRSCSPKSRIVKITCGTDPEELRPLIGAEPLPRLLFIGRLVEQKGLDDLLESLALQGSASIDIVGDGPLRESCERRAGELGIDGRVRFLGGRGRDWIRAEAPRYQCLIAPFKPAPDGARDSGPLVVKEAMSMGLPVIATRFMGNKEMVTEDTGFLVDVADPAALAAAIQRLLDLPIEARRRMGLRGRERVVERFSLMAQARALSALFETAPCSS